MAKSSLASNTLSDISQENAIRKDEASKTFEVKRKKGYYLQDKDEVGTPATIRSRRSRHSFMTRNTFSRDM